MSPLVNVMVNGAPKAIEPGATVADLVRDVRGASGGPGVAVARNGEVVPRGDWARVALDDGDRVEILVATQGG